MKQTLCLPQSEFEFWLKSLSSRKVSPVVRRHLDQLRTHFFGTVVQSDHEGRTKPAVPLTAGPHCVDFVLPNCIVTL